MIDASDGGGGETDEARFGVEFPPLDPGPGAGPGPGTGPGFPLVTATTTATTATPPRGRANHRHHPGGGGGGGGGGIGTSGCGRACRATSASGACGTSGGLTIAAGFTGPAPSGTVTASGDERATCGGGMAPSAACSRGAGGSLPPASWGGATSTGRNAGVASTADAAPTSITRPGASGACVSVSPDAIRSVTGGPGETTTALSSVLGGGTVSPAAPAPAQVGAGSFAGIAANARTRSLIAGRSAACLASAAAMRSSSARGTSGT